MTLTVSVGKKYRDAQGRDVTILTDRYPQNINNAPILYRFIGDKGQSYAEDGSCRYKRHQFRLIAEL